LYMNGVIDRDKSVSMGTQGLKSRYYVKFSCPFVQKRLFNYFSGKIFNQMGRLYEPFDDLDDAVTKQGLNIENIIRRYHEYLMKNREWSLKNAPRRSDMRIYEAVFHFNLYMYLAEFLQDKGGEVFPEFPTGNGQVDIIIKYGGRIYGLELKSYKDKNSYNKALIQAARYGEQLKVEEIFLVFFIENIDDENRKKYEVDWFDEKTGIKVIVIFVETENSGTDT
ncbi:hypothetical protein QUF76_14465, partial [Desulfobacterales bacterium HSG16]|nr:hypothetical protein [Desulfobacterales bacterium HSG16]